MSRIGKKPVQIPAGVDVAVDGSHVTVKGPKGQLELDVYSKLTIEVADGVLTVVRPDDERETRARHGLTRALIANMVEGVSNGYTKALELAGVGYRVQLKGKDLELSLGYSHPVVYKAPEGINLRGARQHAHQREGHRQAAGGPGCRRDPRQASPRALQGQGHPLRGRAHPSQAR